MSGIFNTRSEKQQFLNIPRFRRLQILKLRTHEEHNSDIGTRRIGEMAHDIQWSKYEKPKQVSVFEGKYRTLRPV